MTTLKDICRDLDDEQMALDEIVAGLDAQTWDLDTPAPGWTIRDQISHLAFFDEVGAQAVSDPNAFNSQLGEIASDPVAYMARATERGRNLGPAGVLEWWREARARALEVLEKMEPSERIPWFGPPMKPVSFVTGRLMETWAHGQDIVDTLGIERPATTRLHHVAHMGVRARSFSYQVNGRSAPEGDVRVELTGPAGESWTWGDSTTDIVRGYAEDFCLVVTQRRHPDDTDLEVGGPLATEWIAIAQSFAGPPGGGRKPGQFSERARAR